MTHNVNPLNTLRTLVKIRDPALLCQFDRGAYPTFRSSYSQISLIAQIPGHSSNV